MNLRLKRSVYDRAVVIPGIALQKNAVSDRRTLFTSCLSFANLIFTISYDSRIAAIFNRENVLGSNHKDVDKAI
jgi:hypothetical protein